MYKKRYALFIIFLWKTFFLSLNAQEIGWQQQVDYNISVQLIDSMRLLEGFVQIDYYNRSPDTLNQLFIHLYPNAYNSIKTPLAKDISNGGKTDFHFAKEKDRGNISGLNFVINGETVDWQLKERAGDIAIIKLNKPLEPGELIKITTSFKTKLPKLFSRSGYSDGIFSITQWFPKVAVYDANGWQEMSYLDKGEFYDEFGNYSVKITVPNKYKVAASGQLVNQVINSDSTQSFYFKQEKIHDFAWFTSRKYKVYRDSVILPSGKKVDIYTYSYSKGIFENANEYVKTTLLYYSEKIGDYPYLQCSIVEADQGMGSGMEYPMIANVVSTQDTNFLKSVVVHEVGHNWFQGILANNERENPWMDEGINSYYEKRVTQNTLTATEGMFESLKTKKIGHFFGLNDLPNNPMARYGILMQQRLGRFQKESEPSANLSWINYGLGVYEGVTMDFNVLADYLGISKFDSIMQSFYTKYQFRHVSECDFIMHFEKESQKDLSWFFDGLLSTEKRIDLSIKSVKSEGETFKINLVNRGELGIPFSLSTKLNGEIIDTYWFAPFQKDTTVFIKKVACDQIAIDDQWNLNELKRQNNFYKVGKKCPKFEPLKVQFLGSIENSKRTQINFMPILAGNKYDKFMFGVAVYNRVFPAKNLEYELVPLFAIGSKRLSGIFNVNYFFHPKLEHTREIKIGMHVSTFSFTEKPEVRNYVKVEPHISWEFKPGGESSNWTELLQFRTILISREVPQYDTSDFTNYEIVRTNNWFNELSYKLQFDRKLNPFFAKVTILQSTNYLRASLESKIKLNYGNIKNKYFGIRLFAGGYLWRRESFRFGLNPNQAFGLSAITGENDFLYDGYYFGRSEQTGFSSKQLISGEGNFKAISTLQGVNIGKTANWLMAVNFTADFPWKYLPIQFFADFGYSFNNSIPNGDPLPDKGFHYDAGASISLFDDAFQVHFPLLMDKAFKSYYKGNGNKFKGKITYTFDLKKLNPHATIRDISKFITF